jgi:serine/threonine protein kinase
VATWTIPSSAPSLSRRVTSKFLASLTSLHTPSDLATGISVERLKRYKLNPGDKIDVTFKTIIKTEKLNLDLERQNLMREYQIMHDLDHPNIVSTISLAGSIFELCSHRFNFLQARVYELFEAKERIYMSLELGKGGDLKERSALDTFCEADAIHAIRYVLHLLPLSVHILL